MANVKISDLIAYTDPASSDILPIVDLVNDVTKKVTIADLLENAGDGTAAAPAFAFNSDSNTGLFRSAADSLAITTGGTQRVTVDSSGKVGIGETSPDSLLHLKGTNPFIKFEADSATGNSGLLFSDGANKGQILYDHNGDYMRFSTNGSGNEAMRIDSSGNVYIGGTTAATADIALNANGKIDAKNTVKAYTGSDDTFAKLQETGWIDLKRNSAGLLFRGSLNSTVGIEIQSDGSITAAGIITSGTYNASSASGTGVQVNSGGVLRVQRSSSAGNSASVFEGYYGTTNTSSIAADGSIIASADATINSLTVGRGAGNVSTNTAVGSGALNANTTGGHNAAYGLQALRNNTTGYSNIAVGSGALLSNTTGGNNVANGYQSLLSNTSGYENTAVGGVALRTNTTGVHNVSIGYASMNGNTTGNFNTATGHNALRSNTSGANNVAYGYKALYSNTTGGNNTATGYQSLYLNTTGTLNTSTGYRALYSNTTGYSNTVNGTQSMYSNTTGAQNTASGYQSLYLNTSGNYNTASGYRALYSNTTGSNNVANGYAALRYNTTGNNNVANGYRTLNSNTTGIQNTATGTDALYPNTTGSGNVANGYNALGSNTTGSNNVATGAGTLYTNSTGFSNVASGVNVLYSNTTGYRNVASGEDALYTNSSGLNNVAAGWHALRSNTTGSNNISSGKQALYSNTTASNNVAIGTTSQFSNTTGASNTSIGHSSLHSNTTGSHNVACGESALTANTTASNNTGIGKAALLSVNTGGENTALGNQAGNNITSGARNVSVGSSARPNGATTNDSINIGHDFAGIGANYFTFGKSGNLVYNQFTSNASWTRSSDVRLKKDIQTNSDLGLGFINDLRTVTYKWKAPSELDASLSGYNADKTEADYTNKMYGFIAQEVKQVLDDHNVTDFAGWHVTDEADAIQGISYEMFVMPLVKAVQELSAENAALKARLDAAGI